MGLSELQNRLQTTESKDTKKTWSGNVSEEVFILFIFFGATFPQSGWNKAGLQLELRASFRFTNALLCLPLEISNELVKLSIDFNFVPVRKRYRNTKLIIIPVHFTIEVFLKTCIVLHQIRIIESRGKAAVYVIQKKTRIVF